MGCRGTRYLVRPQDRFIGLHIMRYGAFDAEKIETALALLDDNGIDVTQVLDIGANIGTTTVEILCRRPTATAVAFEPGPQSSEPLRMNLIANRLDGRAQARQIALGDTNGSVTLELAHRNFGDHRVRLTDAPTEGDLGEERRTTTTVPDSKLDDVDWPDGR